MRRALSFAAALLLLTGLLLQPLKTAGVRASAQTKQRRSTSARAVGWSDVPSILARIRPPKFPARDFSITDYGARAGSGFDNPEAIRKAIEACNRAGGGRVVIPSG